MVALIFLRTATTGDSLSPPPPGSERRLSESLRSLELPRPRLQEKRRPRVGVSPPPSSPLLFLLSAGGVRLRSTDILRRKPLSFCTSCRSCTDLDFAAKPPGWDFSAKPSGWLLRSSRGTPAGVGR